MNTSTNGWFRSTGSRTSSQEAPDPFAPGGPAPNDVSAALFLIATILLIQFVAWGGALLFARLAARAGVKGRGLWGRCPL